MLREKERDRLIVKPGFLAHPLMNVHCGEIREYLTAEQNCCFYYVFVDT